MEWSFSCNSIVKLSLYNMTHLKHGPFLWTSNKALLEHIRWRAIANPHALKEI